MYLYPAVSVLIPTYNRLLSLAELMESLYRQTFRDFEVIIVNDGGEDVEPIKALYPELDIRVITTRQNQKHVHARNLGLKYARGRFVMLCDDDDLLISSHLENMMNEIRGYDLVYSDVEIVEYEVRNNIRMPVNRHLFAYRHELEAMKKFSTFVASGCLYRRSIHKRIGYFDTEVYCYWDWDFFLRVSESFRVKRVPSAGVLYAFSRNGDNESGDLNYMSVYLDKLSAKHNLGPLPTKNFFLLLEEPEMRAREAESLVIWDGQPMVSRMVRRNIR